MSRLPVVVAAVLLSSLSTGCAALKVKPTAYTSFGEADPGKDKAIVERYSELLKSTEPRPEVKVLVDTVPEGVDVKDGAITVDKESPHTLVAKFSIGAPGGFFPDYKQSWRKGLCYWQTPLVVATLFAWAAVPTYWPCFSSSAMSRQDLIEATKTLAWSAGANLVVLSYVGASTDEAVYGGVGFLLSTDLSTFDPKKTKPKDKDSKPMAKAPEGGPPLALR
jgi:hypothetical protein